MKSYWFYVALRVADTPEKISRLRNLVGAAVEGVIHSKNYFVLNQEGGTKMCFYIGVIDEHNSDAVEDAIDSALLVFANETL
ncbi:MAG: hypothetical protein HF312_15640 [Ignavibacteria bacterium]|jgi:hypothetical protein|nr:hypothetical protein [Ignavibacteria bacterium]